MKFDAFSIGQTFETKPVTVTKEDIIAFGEKYDPQYFHINEREAEASPYGTLIASGFHTLAVVLAEWISMDVLGRDCLGGTGADKIRWTKPVRPDDQLSGQFTIANKKKVSDGTRGLLTIEIIIKNQKNQDVLTCKTNGFVAA
jgi:acyl dehydratase